MEMSERKGEMRKKGENEDLRKEKGGEVKKNREIKWGKKGFAFPFC